MIAYDCNFESTNIYKRKLHNAHMLLSHHQLSAEIIDEILIHTKRQDIIYLDVQNVVTSAVGLHA